MRMLLFALLMVLSSLQVTLAKEAAPVMGDPVIQARVMHLAGELRCLVCQGESLAESHSDFAADMLAKIRSLVEQGKSDQEIKDYLVARYGDFILYRPPFSGITAFVWIAPAILLLAGGSLFIVNLRRRRARVQTAPLSAEEEARVKTLLSEGDSKA